MEYLMKIKDFIVPSEKNGFKSKFLESNILLYCVILLLVLKIGATLISINFPQNIFFADITKSALENFVNQTRQSEGLAPLAENQKLNQAAQLKAENMVQNQYFNHTSPSGITPWHWFSQAGYNYKYAGENLAIGFFDSKEVFEAWLNSPSHKANITNPNYKEVGTAVVSGFGQNNTIIVVQEFGSQLPAKQVVSKPKPVTSTTQPATSSQITSTNPQTTVSTDEKVLSQETESETPSKVLNSVLYNYDNLLQNVVYGFSLIVIGILLALIFFNLNVSLKKQLVYRAVLIVVLLSVATLINREVIVSLIPHQVII
jgi:hypothetical protein